MLLGMHLVSCEHPKRIYNKYLGEYVWVACKECPTCLKRYRAYWTSRLENERKSSLYTLFITLTYDEEHLPRLHRQDVLDDHNNKVIEAYSDSENTFCIPFNDLKFSSPADLEYFNSKMSTGGVPYAKFRDVQLFLKRFNKYLFTHYTQHYENFRYYIVSELGKSTLRPHYHGLLFFRERIPTADFESDISTCWKLGHCKVEVVESNASSYVSKYVGKSSFYPSFYEHCKIRNKFICSRHTPIGSGFELPEGTSEIFHNAATSIALPANDSSEIRMVPLQPYVENRLFPKCPRFSQISHSCRVALYGCAARFHGKQIKGEIGDRKLKWFPFEVWLNNLYLYVKRNPTHYKGLSQLSYLLSEVADNFSEKGMNALRRLYYLSKRVCLNCAKFCVSLEYYVLQIEKYWIKKEYEILTKFYNFQQSFAEKNNSEELINMYHEFSFQNPNNGMPLLSECRDYTDMCSMSALTSRVSLFSHFKNAFIDSCRSTDKISKSITLKFYYAKECNEIIEAIT